MPTTTLSPEKILRDLQTQWEQLAHEEEKTGGVLRACSMTLVIAARHMEDSLEARQTAGLLMRVHPSRAIVVHSGASDSKTTEFDARVFAECWKPFGRTQQICSEGIEIIAGKAGFPEVARFLVPLRVPDLPVVLWCRGSTATQNTGYHHLFPLVDKIIFDTQNTSEADESLRSLRRLHAYGMRVADLHWARLDGWRETIAHLFDNGLRADEVRSARVTYGGDSTSTCGRYLEAWIRSSLPLARVSLEPTYGASGLESVTMSTPQGDLTITRAENHSLTIRGRGLDYESGLPSTSEAALMSEELSILGADNVYERVLNA
ncbi:MAG: glucose-6-phosphate dehydrogenase assembly protein OpcA [Acidobacteriota bacterium]